MIYCMLIEKHDPESTTLRWSLPERKRCYCEKVAMRISDIASIYFCPDSLYGKPEELWFTDNPIPLKILLKNGTGLQKNWTNCLTERFTTTVSLHTKR